MVRSRRCRLHGVAPLLAARCARARRAAPPGPDPARPAPSSSTATSASHRRQPRLALDRPARLGKPSAADRYLASSTPSSPAWASPPPDQTAQVQLPAADGTWTLVSASPSPALASAPDTPSACRQRPQPTSPACSCPPRSLPSRTRRRRPDHRRHVQQRNRRPPVPVAARRTRRAKNIYAKVSIHNQRYLTTALAGQPSLATWTPRSNRSYAPIPPRLLQLNQLHTRYFRLPPSLDNPRAILARGVASRPAVMVNDGSTSPGGNETADPGHHPPLRSPEL